MYFVDKKYMLISRRYHFHLAFATMQCSNGNTDAHNNKKEE
jgi:hypothetical protein